MKILYIAPHLSTGGCPQFLFKKIQVLHKDHEVYCIEYADYGSFTVQRNRIKEILNDRLIYVNYDRSKIIDIIKDLDPDVVHLEEMPEYFMDHDIAKKIYIKDRRYKIIETSHDSSFDPKTKVFFPDRLIYVSKYQKENLKEIDVPSEVCEYPILINPRKPREEALRVLGLDPKKKHVMHVGLFTSRKNQKEIIEYARILKDQPIQFHFIGNQADNFRSYWEPLMKDFPPNCKWWNERKDVDNFYQAADLFLFVSKDENGDKETSPLVIREAISYNIPTLIYNSPVYMGMYDKYENIKYLDYDDKAENLNRILKTLNLYTTKSMTRFNVKYDNTENKVLFSANITVDNLLVSVKELDSRTVVWAVRYPQLPANSEWWIIPIRKGVIDYETEPSFGGLLVEFYQNDVLLDSKTIRIKPPVLNKYQSKLKNNFEPTYINYTEFFVDKIYDKYLKDKTFDTVVDVGANIGLWTEYIMHTANTKKVYSVEPNTDALKVLKNSFGDEVVVVEKAMFNKDVQLEFFVDSNNSTISSVAKVNGSNTSYKVDAISFKSFVTKYNIKKIDLMKVDIETGEYDLFASMDDSDLDMIDNILMEYHIIGGRTYEKDATLILNQLKAAGFNCTSQNLHAHGGFIFATKSEVKIDDRNKDLKNMLDDRGCPAPYAVTVDNQRYARFQHKVITIVDSFVYNDSIRSKLLNTINWMKEDGHEVLLVSNTVVDKEILKCVKFYLYDSRNQLFQEKYDDVDLVDYWKSFVDGFYIHDVVPVLQKHGLSVMINLFNALLYAKSQGYTHFQRFEVDDIFGKKSREYIKQVPYVCANENKHGLFYYNEGHNPPDMSFHYFYCNIDEFLSKVPRLSNEQDYLNYLKQYHNDNKFRIVEVYVHESLKRNNDSKFLIKFDENAMTLDFPDTRWNTETSMSSFDPKYGKCTTRLYYINEHNKETNTFNRGSSYLVYTHSYHSGSTLRKIVVEKIDGEKYEFIHKTEMANGWAWNEVFSDVKSISVYEDDEFLYREHVADCISYVNLIRK